VITRTLWGLLLTVLAVVTARAADEENEVEEEYAAAVAVLIEDLHDLADWCGSSKLYAERDKAYRSILALDPDDADAHRGLKHSRRRDGTWEVPEDERPSRNYDKAYLKECERKRRAVAVKFRDAVLELLAAHGERFPRALRDAAFDAVLDLAPDDPRVRALRGEVELDGRWVLEATANGKRRRQEIQDAVRAGIHAAGKARKIDAPDVMDSVRWKSAVATENVRCLTVGSLREAATLAQRCEAAAHVFRELFACEAELDEGYTVYLLDPNRRDRFIDGLPGLTDDERAFLKQLAGTGVPETADVARWDPEDYLRLDGAVRHTFGRLFARHFGVFVEDGWIWEGFGLYLTRQLCGTRLTWYVQQTATEDPEIERLRSELGLEKLNWMNEALTLLLEGKTTPFEELLLRGVDQMTVPDLLVSYALAAYLLEGRPQATPELLARIGADQGPVEAFRAVLGFEPDELEDELVRWLGERR